MKPKQNQSVKVALRVRPLNKRQTEMNSPLCVSVSESDNIISIKKGQQSKQFVFDYVFDKGTKQQQIFETSAFGLLQSGLQGYNGTIFAYGQTGAGKTFTMVGDYKDPQWKGIIPRGFQHLITAIHSSQDKKYVMRASFIEIYNEQIMDLLEQKKGNKSQKKDLKQHPEKGLYIKDLKMIPVKSVDELFKILDFGNKNRTVFATAMNATSSRSHALFTVHIQSIEGAEKIKASKINLVDLAGSERQSKTEATGDRLKEGAKINLSLTALGNVINALVDGKTAHIPYRDSKLTRLLQDSLGGNTKTLMIASISPAQFNYDETLSTLRYAARARNIKNKPKINQDPKDAMIRQYLQQIQKLKKRLQSGGVVTLNEQQMSEEDLELLKEVQQKVQQKQKVLQEKDKQLRIMEEKLKQMQGLVLKKQDVPQDVAKQRRIKKKKIKKQQQLLQKKIEDIQKHQHQLIDLDIQSQPKNQTPQKQASYWKNMAKSLQKKLRQSAQDNKDLQKQFQQDRQDLNATIRNLQSDLSFYSQIAKKFMSDADLETVKANSKYDEQKRAYQLASFLMHEDQISLPKALKKNEVEDLWQEKRKHFKLKLSEELPQVQNTKSQSISIKGMISQLQDFGSPFIRNRKIFKIPDYNNPIYQEKQYDPNSSTGHMFRRTNFRINEDSRSRSKSQHRSTSKTKLQPLKNKLQEEQKRPTSRSKGKQKLEPINRK